MTKEEEAKFEAKAEKHFRMHHRNSPGGRRDYRAFKQRDITQQDRENFRKNYDIAFPDAPGAGI